MSKRIEDMIPGETFWYAMQQVTVVRQIKRGALHRQTEIRTPDGTIITTSGLDPSIHAKTKEDLGRHTATLNKALHG